MAGTPSYLNRPAPKSAAPAPIASLETTTEGLWLLQALCGVEELPAVLVCRPYVSAGGAPVDHPGIPTLRQAGAIVGEHDVHPQIRLWLETVGAPDIVLACMVRRGQEHLRVAIARRGHTSVSITRHGDQMTVENLGAVTVASLVERLLPLCGAVVAPAKFEAARVPTAELLSALAEVLRGEHSAAVALGRLGLTADQRRIATLAADQPLVDLSMAVVTYRSDGEIQVSKATASVTDTAEGRVVIGPVRSDNGAWWTQIGPGTPAAAKSALTHVLGTVGLREWDDRGRWS